VPAATFNCSAGLRDFGGFFLTAVELVGLAGACAVGEAVSPRFPPSVILIPFPGVKDMGLPGLEATDLEAADVLATALAGGCFAATFGTAAS
jgi:hypothetical protein